MHDFIARKQAEIFDLCRAHHVRRLELFGSATGEEFVPGRSDTDFLVEFDDGAQTNAFADYFDLKTGLEALLGCPVDLVMPAAVRNRYFLSAIARDRVRLYGA